MHASTPVHMHMHACMHTHIYMHTGMHEHTTETNKRKSLIEKSMHKTKTKNKKGPGKKMSLRKAATNQQGERFPWVFTGGLSLTLYKQLNHEIFTTQSEKKNQSYEIVVTLATRINYIISGDSDSCLLEIRQETEIVELKKVW